MMLLCLWEALCVALFWTVFCRLVKTSRATRAIVRAALTLMGAAALAGIGAPIYAWAPDPVHFIIIVAVLAMQIVMARDWAHGVPRHFLYEQYRPQRRRSDHHAGGHA